ncbi:MAG: response regulator transcription factor [Proteobacteria bacterium]|nr:response regulator transcription factor [Pseudomonadota bacterium]
MLRILIADDHPVFRNGLKHIIAEETDMVVEDEAKDGKEALSLLDKKTYDVLVLDIDMPGMSGLEVLKQVKTVHPDLPVLMLSFFPEEQYAIRALKFGASGYVTKETAAAELVEALKRIVSGKKYITASLAEQLSEILNNEKPEAPHEKLSNREHQIFCRIAEGKSIADISEEFCLSPKTVSTYRMRIFEKMQMKNDAQLVRYAIEKSIVR